MFIEIIIDKKQPRLLLESNKRFEYLKYQQSSNFKVPILTSKNLLSIQKASFIDPLWGHEKCMEYFSINISSRWDEGKYQNFNCKNYI